MGLGRGVCVDRGRSRSISLAIDTDLHVDKYMSKLNRKLHEAIFILTVWDVLSNFYSFLFRFFNADHYIDFMSKE